MHFATKSFKKWITCNFTYDDNYENAFWVTAFLQLLFVMKFYAKTPKVKQVPNDNVVTRQGSPGIRFSVS